MTLFGNLAVERAPDVWAAPSTSSESRLHQLSPYIGKLKSVIAADLVSEFTKPGELVVDPFCGSGTIPLACALAGRGVFASDVSSYATVLTRAKLRPPRSVCDAREKLEELLRAATKRQVPDLRSVPLWVRRFFHPRTLREAIAFADECLERDECFMLACLLGILHHQRTGFLSYPSSHLVPYLRGQKFPRDSFPDLYAYRPLAPRMLKKVCRALSADAEPARIRQVRSVVAQKPIECLELPEEVGSVITSPPYMNALDYRRDNRLRLWFLERDVEDYSPEPTDRGDLFVRMIVSLATRVAPRIRAGGYCVLVVGEAVRRKRTIRHPADAILNLFEEYSAPLELVRVVEDRIPDVRRSRRAHSGTKKELILVFRKSGGMGVARRKTLLSGRA